MTKLIFYLLLKPMSLKEIKKVLANDLQAFDILFKDSVKSSVPLLNTITNYMIRAKGKQMRPLFVLLSAKLNGGITTSSHLAASLIEILHTATLIHDDVVDEANKRRGILTINRIWKNKISVLLGDYLLSRGLLLATDNKEYELLSIISNATKELSEGELLQIQKSRSLDIDENTYYEIIRKKTASLIAACCSAGAASSGANKENVDKMHQIGESIGIAFQIRDDLLDIEKKSKSGKSKNVDLKDKKLTLPLIYLFETMKETEVRKIKRKIKKHHDDDAKMQEVADFISKSDGIKYAWKKMDEYKNKALKLLDDYKDSETKRLFVQLIEYAISRNK